MEVSLPHVHHAIATYYIVATAEASSNLARFDGVRYGRRAPETELEAMYGGRRGHHRGRDLPAHPAQGRLPAALPEPDDVRAHALAPGPDGALRMGMEHGGWCVGCCWGLMAALFALGVMSIGWMVLIAAVIALEKLLPWKAVANRSVAVLLLVLGLAVALVPDKVPGLTLPDSPAAAQAMDSMGMHDGSRRRIDERSEDAFPGGMNAAKNGMPAP